MSKGRVALQASPNNCQSSLCFFSTLRNTTSDGGRGPSGVFVERIDRSWQLAPGEVCQYRRRQARAVDLVDLLGPEELVEAAAEMAAALDHDQPCLGDVESEHLELTRVHALAAMADHHELDAAEVEQG